MSDPLSCPRCGGIVLIEHECGPDSYDDDIVWQAWSCNQCRLWFSGWREKWFIDVDSWQDETYATEYKPPSFYGVAEVAERLGVLADTVRQWERRGLIRCSRTKGGGGRAGRRMFPVAEVRQLDELRARAACEDVTRPLGWYLKTGGL